MTSYARPTERPTQGSYSGFDHIQFYCSNAKQAAAYYCIRFGFKPVAYRGLETGSRDSCSHVVKQNNLVFVFTSPYNPVKNDISDILAIQGDSVRDVAFTVDNARSIHDTAVSRGAVSVQAPTELSDENGTVVIATVKTYGNTVHSFIERKNYNGVFLPGYNKVESTDPVLKLFNDSGLLRVDHVVGNQPDLEMTPACDWYEKMLNFHRFWSVDDSQIHSEYSALRSIVMTDFDEVIKMPINEPAQGKRKSQIQEYVDYHGGAGVQHIALLTNNIVETVSNLRSRGLEFLSVPHTYYVDVKQRLAKSPVKVLEDIDLLESLQVLIDFDDQGYLLQLFTKPQEDRPTLFFEVIQRANHQGFGAGNFKALFESIERDQELRGNL